MKRQIAITILFVILSIIIFLGTMSYLKENTIDNSYKLSTLDFNFEDIDGKLIANDFFIIKPCLIIFFNTQCDLCLYELDLLNDKRDDITSKYNLIFVSFEPKKSLQVFFKDMDFSSNAHTYIVSDIKEKIINHFNIESYPAFLLLDQEQNISERGSIINEEVIERLLNRNLNYGN